MNVWMSIFNTTTQNLENHNRKNSVPANTKIYLKQKFNQLIGSVKLFIALDSSIAFTDNHLIDSGLIRGLFEYGEDSEIRRMRDELKDTFFIAAERNLLLFKDNRIKKEGPEAIVRERFDLSRKYNMIHSAAFGNEGNWEHIDNYDEITKELPGVKNAFQFLIELFDRIPKTNIIDNPQKEDSFGRSFEHLYEIEKGNFPRNISYLIEGFLKKYSVDLMRTRTKFYDYLKENNLGQTDQELLNRLFTDKIYNNIVPLEAQSYNFADWGNYYIFPKDDISRVINVDNTINKSFPKIDALFKKGEMFNFLASRKLSDINLIQDDIRSWMLSDSSKKVRRKAKSVLWDLYQTEDGKIHNKDLTKSGLTIIQNLVESYSEATMGLVIPILKSAVNAFDWVQFLYLTKIDPEYKSTITIIDKVLSNQE